MKLIFIRSRSIASLLALACFLFTGGLSAQVVAALPCTLTGPGVPCFEGPVFQNDCSELEFTWRVPGVQLGSAYIRSIGGANQEGFTYTGTVPNAMTWDLTIPATAVRATFRTPSGLYVGANGNLQASVVSHQIQIPALATPQISFAVNGLLTDNFFNICPFQVLQVEARVNGCVIPESWDIELIGSYNGINVFEGAVTDGTASTKGLNIISFNSAPATSTFRITGEVGITGQTVSRTFTVSSANCRSRGFKTVSNKELADVILKIAPGEFVDHDYTAEEIITAKVPGFFADRFSIDATRVFPNPARDVVNVQYKFQPEQLRLIDINGRTVRAFTGAKLGDVSTRIDVNDLATGLYLLETISKEGERSVTKVQVNR